MSDYSVPACDCAGDWPCRLVVDLGPLYGTRVFAAAPQSIRSETKEKP